MTADPTPSQPARGKRPPHGEPVVERAFALLAAFDARHRSLTLAELARRSGLPKTTALRLARVLTGLGALERSEDGAFSIGVRLFEIATLAPRAQGLRAVAMPYLEDLGLVTRQHVLLAVRDGEEAVLVERLSAPGADPVLYRVGGRLPLHSTGVGHVLLAHAGFDEQAAYLARDRRAEPEGVPVRADALRRDLAAVRRDGFAVVARPAPAPMVSVAAPVRDAAGEVVAALSVVVPDGGADVRHLVPAVRTAARAVSRGLGGR
ncbi:IclR family transcriptional regulator [Actinomadura atramentaria]|uniref:IclR family transcriptional regulator n=1 Tax=Actinomadura atramentaria TaxID=1990 RepID=UPI00037F4CCF|nr:IclR family transcriptional regulator [Actinomadura atramentaria]